MPVLIKCKSNDKVAFFISFEKLPFNLYFGYFKNKHKEFAKKFRHANVLQQIFGCGTKDQVENFP